MLPTSMKAVVTTGHGGMDKLEYRDVPVPAPAVVELMRGLEYSTGGGCERLTPTGACVLLAIVDEWAPPQSFTPTSSGYGAGTKETDVGPPNLCRVQLGVATPEGGGKKHTRVWQVECNLDDTTGEELGWCLAGLREAGALDAWSVPVGMKKGRPGVVVCALARAEDRSVVEEALFQRTPTLGVRWREVERTECDRDEVVVEVLGARVRVKRRLGAAELGVADLSPEQDDLEALARESGRPLREVGRLAVEAALARADATFRQWRTSPLDERTALLARLGDLFEAEKERLAEIATREMGKTLKSSIAEVEKCAAAFRHYAEHGPSFLEGKEVAVSKGAARTRWNILMVTATLVATLGAGWASYGKIGWWGPGLILAFGVAALLTKRGGNPGIT